jgi:hypothetical protein
LFDDRWPTRSRTADNVMLVPRSMGHEKDRGGRATVAGGGGSKGDSQR